ncbi:hypothetical protein ULF88_07680 [Halopseudomonas pachastrellae]|nr:hypothetical protein [Halopseudomonas pachastrellae]
MMLLAMTFATTLTYAYMGLPGSTSTSTQCRSSPSASAWASTTRST